MRNQVKTVEKTLHPIEHEHEFFSMYDALMKHKSEFVASRGPLLEAWKRGGELYTLKIKETGQLWHDQDLCCDMFCLVSARPSWLLLPVFCWRGAGDTANDTCFMLWTAPYLRRLGLASELVGLLGIGRARAIMPASRSFWENLSIPEVDCFHIAW